MTNRHQAARRRAVVDAFPPVSLGGSRRSERSSLSNMQCRCCSTSRGVSFRLAGTEGYAAVSECQLARRFRDHSEGNLRRQQLGRSVFPGEAQEMAEKPGMSRQQVQEFWWKDRPRRDEPAGRFAW